MRAGRLRHRIIIERLTLTTDEYGDRVENWSELYRCAASVEPQRGHESYLPRGEVVERSSEIIIRYSKAISDLSPRDRIIHDGAVWDIDDVVNPGGRNRMLKITCAVQR